MEKIYLTTGRNNCGGCCRLRVHVEDGRITRLSADPDDPEPGRKPCVRGLHYADTFLNERRLLAPMKRVGPRGAGEFRAISWDQALDELADNWTRIRDKYGPQSRYVNYAWGESGVLSGTGLCKRLLRLDGGHLDYYNDYSTACAACATPYVYGTADSGSSYSTLTSSKLILLWAHNPAEIVFDDLMYWLRKAKENGARIVVVDPRKSATCKALDAQWVPIRPATDGAMLAAMAWVILTEGLYDLSFLHKHVLGWREWFSYLTGQTDGVPKTPAWAAPITGVPAEVIRGLAIDYAASKPAALLPGYGGQRHENGEQFTRAVCALACLTGNVGVRGGWAGGVGWCPTHPLPKMPSLPNPVTAAIPSFLWTEAIQRGPELTPADGLTGAPRLDTGVKMLFNLAGNMLMNQHGDLNRTAAILRDEALCEYIVCSDLFMTPSAKFADLLLPGTSLFEQDNLTTPWSQGDFLGYSQKIIEPMGQCRFEYDWLAELAARLGLRERFTEGRSSVDWLEHLYNGVRLREPELPEFSAFRTMGTYRYKHPIERIAFQTQVQNGAPFPTTSGKIELYSEALAARHDPKTPPLPEYVPADEGFGGNEAYPLQLVGWHTLARTHSVGGNNPALLARHPQVLWIHPADAASRGIADGDPVLVYNDRGRIRVPARVTKDIAPGVTALAQGAWYDPAEDGTDVGGSINVLTGHEATPLAHGNPQHTILVDAKKG